MLHPVLTLALILAAAVPAAPAVHEAAPAASIAIGARLRSVALEDLRARPLHHLGEHVEFAFQVAPAGPAPDPLWTRFSPVRWRHVRGWGDRQFPWVRAHFDDPAPFVFARRGSPAEVVLGGARPHERYLVRATVREVALGEPWIEIHSALRVEPSLAEGTVLHATKAVELAEVGKLDLAIHQVNRALAAPMPDGARTELERLSALWTARRDAAKRRR